MDTEYWFFVRDDGQFKWAVISGPQMSLEKAKEVVQTLIGKTVVQIGYGNQVPDGLGLLPKYQLNIKNC